MKQRIYRGYLMLNWRNGSMRIIKSKPKNTNPYEVPVPFSITLRIPEMADVKGIIVDTELPIIDVNEIKM